MRLFGLKSAVAAGAAVAAAAVIGGNALAAADTITLEFLGNNMVSVNGLAATPMTVAQQQQQQECQQIINTNPTGDLTKTFTGFVQNGQSWTYFYHYHSTGTPPFEQMTDCLFDVTLGTIITRVDETPATPTSQDNDTSAPISNHFNDLICDRIRLSGPNTTTEYSNLVGVQAGRPASCQSQPNVPEAPWAAIFVPVGLGALGAGWYVTRRRNDRLAE